MFDLLEKLFEVVATEVNPEKKMQDYYKKTINTKLTKSTFLGERDYLKFWLLTNGNIIPVIHCHEDMATDSGTSYFNLLADGAYAGSILDGELNLSGDSSKPGKFTSAQISKLKNLYIEHKIIGLVVSAKEYFGTPVKSSKELAYYLEYGKEEWESKIKDDLLEKILEANATAIRRKHRSIKRLFPDFDAKTKGVEDKGGLRFVDQDAETWKF